MRGDAARLIRCSAATRATAELIERTAAVATAADEAVAMQLLRRMSRKQRY